MSNMGDGDLADSDDAGMDDNDVAMPASGAANTAPVDDHADTAPDDDASERGSEVDDLIDSILHADAQTPDYSGVDVAAVLAEREEFKGLAQRVQADFDNFRKRAATQGRADTERATGRMAEALLPVLDAAEAAFVRHPNEVAPLLNQMLAELKKLGLEVVELEGQPFDPEVAEAVHHEPGDGGEPVVAEVLRTGYQWKGRTLRPAMVKTKD
jgi:molecular chaperone GrpE